MVNGLSCSTRFLSFTFYVKNSGFQLHINSPVDIWYTWPNKTLTRLISTQCISFHFQSGPDLQAGFKITRKLTTLNKQNQTNILYLPVPYHPVWSSGGCYYRVCNNRVFNNQVCYNRMCNNRVCNNRVLFQSGPDLKVATTEPKDLRSSSWRHSGDPSSGSIGQRHWESMQKSDSRLFTLVCEFKGKCISSKSKKLCNSIIS